MIIDLREDALAIRAYIRNLIAENARFGKAKFRVIHFGFTFDHDGWMNAYLDPRPNASCDGEWTVHISPEALLPRHHWHEASQLGDLRDVSVIGVDGEEVAEWSAHPELQTFANILGNLIKSAVTCLIDEGAFRPLLGSEPLVYCVEEFSGLYRWPLDPELVKFAESLRAKLRKEEELGR
jgi:hypothetical protein